MTMTMPYERTRAVLQTREFLKLLLDSGATPVLPKDIRDEALRLLRHYPVPSDMAMANLACPSWFGLPGEDA